MLGTPTGSHLYLIALGSNLGDRRALLAQAKVAIAGAVGQVLAEAPVYETAPIGAADQPFLNSALIAASALAPPAALERLLAIEASLGRVRREKWGNRPIDLDLLLWRSVGDPAGQPTRCFDSPELAVPHPRMLERAFVLVPACDIAADWIHPESGRTLAGELAARGFSL